VILTNAIAGITTIRRKFVPSISGSLRQALRAKGETISSRLTAASDQHKPKLLNHLCDVPRVKTSPLYQNTVRKSGSRHSRQNNSGHDTTDATEAQPQRQVMQRDTQRCSDACADRDRQAKFVLPISHGLCVHASTISSPAIEQSALQAIHHSKANCKIKAVFSLSHAAVLVAIHQISSLGSCSKRS
jgi:hypothetical protein